MWSSPARGVMPRHPEHTFGCGCGRTEGQGSPQQLLGHSPTPPGSRGEHMPYASPPVPGNTLNRGIKIHPSQPETTEPRLWLVFQHSREQVGCCRNGNSLWEPGPGSACRATPPRNVPSGIPRWSWHHSTEPSATGAGAGVPPLSDGLRGNQRVLAKSSIVS